MAFLFSEAGGDWQAIPEWVGFLIQFGYCWPREESRPRRIALVSMPSKSAAAGLITLGAMIRDLARPNANDIDGHCDRLLGFAGQYLNSCRNCELPSCDPELKGCGYDSKATGEMLCTEFPHRIFRISDSTDFARRQIAISRGGLVIIREPKFATGIYIHGEPPPEWTQPEGELRDVSYRNFVGNAQILQENLRKSYSGLCFVGHALGEESSRESCAALRFRENSVEFGLEELLSIQSWSPAKVSRVCFFNTRTGALDRHATTPSLAVADGDAAFLKILARPEFRQGDVVGATHRILERDRLEALGVKTLPNQWYEMDEDLLCELPPVPRGISISILRRRANQ